MGINGELTPAHQMFQQHSPKENLLSSRRIPVRHAQKGWQGHLPQTFELSEGGNKAADLVFTINRPLSNKEEV
ncbi:hypothetical protein [Bifidobacterium moukalabense]|uniref:hypothetical protein n=1 Tax=Bifidobacterium moukalabense TaxID=1333651 RepID=UPI0010F9AC3B|nr:hypothetical protein [Bifidobacterium moukalabense]